MTPPPGTPLMDVREFVEHGYLHEVNRRLLHPLGLALEVEVEDRCLGCGGSGKEHDDRVACPRCQGTGKRPEEELAYRITGVWDQRGDPEGIRYALDLLSLEAAQNIDRLWAGREAERKERLGYMVQPPDPQSLTAGALLDA